MSFWLSAESDYSKKCGTVESNCLLIGERIWRFRFRKYAEKELESFLKSNTIKNIFKKKKYTDKIFSKMYISAIGGTVF